MKRRLLNLLCWVVFALFWVACFAAVDTSATDPRELDSPKCYRPEYSTSPEWQGRSVVDGALDVVTRPSQGR